MSGHEDQVGRRVAVVTGARQGIGRRLAEVLAAEGYALALLDVQPADETLAAVRDEAGVDAHAVVVDVAREAEVEAAATSVLDRFGRVDALVNNAAVMLVTAAEATTADQWRHAPHVDLTGTFLVSRASRRSRLDRRRGSIGNIASIAGRLGCS